jgi:hypothetical protein
LLAALAPAQAKGTLAGTVVTASAQVAYVDAITAVSVQTPDANVTVAASPSVTLSLPHASDNVAGAMAFPCVVTNTGNSPDDVTVALTPSSNTYSIMVHDDNADGVWQGTESRTMVSLKALPPDQPVAGLLVVQSNPGTPVDAQGTVKIAVNSGIDTSVQAQATFTATYVTKLAPQFRFQAQEPFTSSATVVNNIAIAGSDSGVVYAVNVAGPTAGQLAWRFPAAANLGAPIRGRVATDGVGYYFTANNGMCYRLDTAGRLVWQQQVVPAGVEMEAMPLVGPNDVTLACGDGRIRRFNKDTGALISISVPVGNGVLTTPSMPGSDGIWVGSSDGALYNISTGNGYAVMSARELSQMPISATPFVDARSGLVLTTTPEGNVYALISHSDIVKWGPVSLGTPVMGSPWVDSAAGIAYFGGTDNTIRALNVADGSPVAGYPAQFKDGGSFLGTPVVDPMPNGKSVLFAATTTGRVYGIRPSDPTRFVEFATTDPNVKFVGSPAVSSAAADGIMVVAGTDGALYGFSAAAAVAP